MDEKTYSQSHELRNMATKIIDHYHLYLGHIDLDNIYFADIDGEKPKRAGIMQIGGITSEWVRQLLQKTNGALYCISVWREEWEAIFAPMQEWMMFDALMRINPNNDGKLVKPDVNEFGIVVEFIGPYWRSRTDLPSLLDGDPLAIPLPKDNESDLGSTVDF